MRPAAREFIEAQRRPGREATTRQLSWPLVSSRSTQLVVLAAVALAAAFGVAVALGAFGDGKTVTKAEYGATVSNARDRVDFALLRITRSESIEDLIGRIDEASAVVGATGDDLDDAGVAEGFDDLHERLVDRLHAFSDELAGTAAQFEDPTFSGVLGGINSLGFLQWEEVNKVLTQMRDRGLDVQLLERH